ncbi:MAG: adenylyltransferase/cytidyltransferase family protein [bacterium]
MCAKVNSPNFKIKSLEEVTDIVRELQQQGKTIVTTNGSFDVLHAAHVKFLQEASQLGDILVVLVNSDSSIRAQKGPERPIIPEQERMEMLAALECVDYVCLFSEVKVIRALSHLKPNVHVKGGTFIAERVAEEKELVEKHGGKMVTLNLIEGYSTTNLINRILERYRGN